MAKLAVDTFLSYLRRSELVQENRLEPILASIFREANSEECQDSDFVAAELVKQGLITNWHVRQLMKKKYKGFYLRQYRILGHLGTGGMSTVYLAEHTLMQRRVAIKVLPKKKLVNNIYLDRFIREAQASASLDHPNIVRAYDIDCSEDIHYIVMEYFEGCNLRQLVEKEGPLPFEDAVNFIRQAAEGLIHAHRIGVIHRDIKPENILVNDQGVTKILDLGLALLDESVFSQPTSSINEDKILGTADYLAPEQAIDSHNVDARADIYSLGCSLYYCLTGHAPFPFGTIPQRLLAHQKETPKSIFEDRPDSPQDLVDLCNMMMEKKPQDRLQSASEVARVMEHWLIHHGFAETRDFPASADLDASAFDSSGEKASDGSSLFSGTFSYFSNSNDAATEYGDEKNQYHFGDFSHVHSGVGNEDVVNLMGSEGGTGSLFRSDSQSSSRFSLGRGSQEEFLLSKNSYLNASTPDVDPLDLAMNEIQTEISAMPKEKNEANEKTASQNSLVSSNSLDAKSMSPGKGDRSNDSSSLEKRSDLETARQERGTRDGWGTWEGGETSRSSSQRLENRSQVDTFSNARPSSSAFQRGQNSWHAAQESNASKTQRPASENAAKQFGASRSAPKNGSNSAFEIQMDQTQIQESDSLYSSKRSVEESPKKISGGWYKEVPFWFWMVFLVGYVLATFLAGILFALLMNL